MLRGPKGTLYGRNTVGGAVKYVMCRLDADRSMLRARLALGNYQQVDGVLSGSAPASDTFRVGGAIASFNRNGFGRNLTTGDENYDKKLLALRATLEW